VGEREAPTYRRLVKSQRFLIYIVGFLAVAAVACASPAATSTPAPAADVVFVIPSGTEAALERGEPAFQFPEQIRVRAGQSVVITNHDYAMHYFFDIPVAPEQTIRKPFPRSGDFVYQGGLSCSISRGNIIKVHAD
jgi:hypothetical protein